MRDSESETYSLLPEEVRIIEAYRRIKRNGHGDLEVHLEISVKDGTIVKLWTTEKENLGAVKPPQLRGI